MLIMLYITCAYLNSEFRRPRPLHNHLRLETKDDHRVGLWPSYVIGHSGEVLLFFSAAQAGR